MGSLLNSRSDEGSFTWRDFGRARHGVEATDGPEWFFRPTRKSEREHTLCHHVFRGDTPRKSNEACFQGGKMIAGVILEPMIPASVSGGEPPSESRCNWPARHSMREEYVVPSKTSRLIPRIPINSGGISVARPVMPIPQPGADGRIYFRCLGSYSPPERIGFSTGSGNAGGVTGRIP